MNLSLVQTILTVVFGIAAIISIVIAVRLTHRKKPVWAYITTKIIGLGTDAPAELKLLFNNKQIPDVYRTILIFFNKGNESIRKDDITDEITVHLHGAQILRDASATIVNKPTTRLSPINRGQDKFAIDFFYLDHHDGAVIEVLHTEYDRIDCDGNIIGAGKPRNLGSFTSRRPEGFYAMIMFSIFFAAVLVYTFLENVLKSIQETLGWLEIGGLVLVCSFFVFVLFTVYIPIVRYYSFPRWSRT